MPKFRISSTIALYPVNFALIRKNKKANY